MTPARIPPENRILAFHDIGKSSPFSVNCLSVESFRRLIGFIAEKGYIGKSLSQYAGEKDLAFTFDDGLESFYKYAFPILRQYSFSVTVFVVTGFVGKKSDWDYLRRAHLNWTQIIELHGEGVEFGSHSHSHRDLRSLSIDLLTRELAVSRSILEDKLGTTVNRISYPFGRFNRNVLQAAQESGYRFGYSLARAGGPMAIPRRCFYAFDGPGSLIRKMQGSPIETFKEKTINAFAAGTILYKKIFGDKL